MTPDERQKMLTEARTFYLAAPVMLPLIRGQKHIAFERLMGKYRDGHSDYGTLVAELYVLHRMEQEIKGKEDTFKLLEEKSK